MAKLAVIETGGKQYLVKVGDKVRVEKLTKKVGDTVDFEPLLVADESGKEAKVGTPKVKGAKVTAEVLRHGRAKKIEVVKYKPKIRYKRRLGHRQPYTQLEIKAIKS